MRRASAWEEYPDCSSLFVTDTGFGEAGADGNSHFSESPVALSPMISPIPTFCKILWKQVVRQEKLVVPDHILACISSVFFLDGEHGP